MILNIVSIISQIIMAVFLEHNYGNIISFSYDFVGGKKSYMLSNLQQKVLCVTKHLLVGRKVLLLLNLFRVKRYYMTNNTFYSYQNDYNNTVFGDKKYHLTDSTFFVLEKGAICQIAHIFI